MSDSLDTSLLGRMVLMAELMSMKNSSAPLLLQVGYRSMEHCDYGVLSRPISTIGKLV